MCNFMKHLQMEKLVTMAAFQVGNKGIEDNKGEIFTVYLLVPFEC
jgi:hypothetical protein